MHLKNTDESNTKFTEDGEQNINFVGMDPIPFR